MKLLNFSIIRLSIALIAGIILSKYLHLTILQACCLFLLSFALLTVTYFTFKTKFRNTFWFDFATYLTTICLGIFTFTAQNNSLKSSDFSKKLRPNASNTVTFKINTYLKPNAFNERYYVDILSIDNNSTTGKALLNIKLDSVLNPFSIDHIYLTKTNLEEIKAPLNPDQFSYKDYLKNQNVHYQFYVSKSHIIQLETKTYTLKGIAFNFRHLINRKLKEYNFSKDELSIINALLLGQRQYITKDVYDNYTNAGAIHILAVSGLHVGIILLILNLLLKPLERFKHGLYLKTALIFILLWLYALIAGGSASIIRATTMFSIVAIGLNLKRSTNIYNTLGISIFILLLFKPNFLFDVGFQLSYAAVFSIVSIQPLIEPLLSFKYKLLDILWKTLTVTVSAQFGIIPISLYYFHQFPSLFWLSNLVVIPLLGIILGLGILIIFLALINILPHFLAEIYGSIIHLMNLFFKWISSQEQFLFQDISFNSFQVLLSYILLFFCYKLITTKQLVWVIGIGLICIGFQMNYIIDYRVKQDDKFYVFHKNKFTLIGEINGGDLSVYSNLKDAKTNIIIRSYSVKNNVSIKASYPLQSLYSIKDQTLLLIDSLGVYNVKELKPDIVLLTQSPKVNLKRLIDSIKPKLIIADGSNYKSYLKRWETTCEIKKIPFYRTDKMGAYLFN
ncbi:ComEC family competence protein [Mesoflavibacter profundi]|uniref:ComEC family competence protein n=1 Tax=Mesoflavibacter profundi TaxID=2708110 RepID=A0ABT4S0G8_9FLAO|nr:ComEC/Rec2 family competence protein [Mesoflavibacter profundi]MDA0177554.1 ComEC family competence protein [Mesoflavibacter profundi]